MRRARILLVEDDPDGREMMRCLLELSGHDVYEAGDGPTGIEAILELRPDVALVDLGLPGLDGYEVARRVRGTLEGRALRLIALSGYGGPDERNRSEEAGFDAHLVKPVDPLQLTSAIDLWVAEPLRDPDSQTLG